MTDEQIKMLKTVPSYREQLIKHEAATLAAAIKSAIGNYDAEKSIDWADSVWDGQRPATVTLAQVVDEISAAAARFIANARNSMTTKTIKIGEKQMEATIVPENGHLVIEASDVQIEDWPRTLHVVVDGQLHKLSRGKAAFATEGDVGSYEYSDDSVTVTILND